MKRAARASFLQVLRLLAISAMIGGVFMLPAAYAEPRDASDVWISSPEGQTLLRPFRNAPYPHSSREHGYTYDDKFFDAATHYSDSTIGIFIPAGYDQTDSVDYVVHFHGWSNHVSAVLERYDLRKQLVASGRNAILLVPQGPKDAADSGGGHLEKDEGAFAQLIDEVTQFLVSCGKVRSTHIGRIVLSTHSGGYLVTSQILAHGGLADRITDVLLFDSSYGGLEIFADWATVRGHRLVSIFTEHLAAENFTLLTLLQKRHATVTAIMEPDIGEKLLGLRQPTLVHTPDLPHDEIIQKRGYFALFLRTIGPEGKLR